MDLLLVLILYPLGSSFGLYAILFFALVLSAVGLPIPEEAILLLGGYFAYLEFVDFWNVTYVLMAGIVIADAIGYAIGRFAGNWLYDRIASRSRHMRMMLEKAKIYTQRYGEKVVLFSRPLSGVRVVVPILMGHFQMRFTKFILFDIIAAAPWTLLLVWVSYYIGSGLALVYGIKKIRYVILMVLIVIIGGIVVWRYIKRRNTRA